MHISGKVLATSVPTTLNPPSTTAMERQPRTLFAVLITLVILAMAYFYCEQIEFKFMLKTRRQLNSLPAIKKKSNLFVAADVAARTGNKTTKVKCDKECSRFQDLVRNWDKFPNNTNFTKKPIAAVYILAHKFARIKNCLQQLDKHFINKFRYPVIIFHENDFGPYIESLRSFTKMDLYFQEIHFTLPDFINGTKLNIDRRRLMNNSCGQKPISYRHMCRFQSKLIYEQPIMQNLEYYWRLDDDSLILRPIEYDVFEFMKNNGFLYGYINHRKGGCVEGLWNATARYIAKTRLKPTYFDKWTDEEMFYNNFEISAISIWLSDDYKRYIDFIDREGGIFYVRWGDAPIKGLALSLFTEWDRLHYFKDIGYQHGSWYANFTGVILQ